MLPSSVVVLDHSGRVCAVSGEQVAVASGKGWKTEKCIEIRTRTSDSEPDSVP